MDLAGEGGVEVAFSGGPVVRIGAYVDDGHHHDVQRDVDQVERRVQDELDARDLEEAWAQEGVGQC